MKKNYFRPLFSWATGLLMLCTLSCQERLGQDALLTNGEGARRNARLSAEKGALEISYEVETVTHNEVVSYGTEKGSIRDVIYNAPTVTRAAVQLKILEDGSVESEMLYLEPKNKGLRPQHKSRPDPTPPIVRVVSKGGYLYFYNNEGKQTGTRQVPVENLRSVLDELKTAKSKAKSTGALTAAMSEKAGTDAATVLEMAKAKNARIKELSPSVKEVELDHEPAGDRSKAGISSFRMKYRLDTKRNVMLNSELYDKAANKLLNRTAIHYKRDAVGNEEVLSTVYSEDYRENPKTGRREKGITTSHYENFRLINNL